MKKLLLISGLTILLVLICAIMLNAQVSNWRTNPPQPSTPQVRVETPRVQPSVPQRNENVSRTVAPILHGYLTDHHRRRHS